MKSTFVLAFGLACTGCIELDAPQPIDVPDGWRSVWVLEADPSTANLVVTCSMDTVTEIYWGNPAVDGGSCGSCECTYTNAECSSPGLSCDLGASAPNCSVIDELKYEWSQCDTDTTTPTGNAACFLSSPPDVINPGQCTGGPSVPNEPMWGTMFRTCPTTSNGCTGAECFSKPPADLEGAKLCITQQGYLDCPDGWLSETLTAYSGGQDQRGCGTCQCDLGTVQCVGGKITLFDSPGCPSAGPNIIFENLMQCTDVDGFFDGTGISMLVELGTPVPGACSPPLMTGTVFPEKPRTICCR